MPVERAAGCDWKYHQGMPFCAQIVAAPGVSSCAEPRRELGQAVRLERDEHDVGVGDRVEVVGRRGCAVKSPRGESTRTPRSRIAREVRAARDQRDVGAAAGERRADVRADRPGAEHGEPHRREPLLPR